MVRSIFYTLRECQPPADVGPDIVIPIVLMLPQQPFIDLQQAGIVSPAERLQSGVLPPDFRVIQRLRKSAIWAVFILGLDLPA
ncbi:hypothetical protein HMSSN036_08950 [Paenibacillus macerans]|nr:hypothetical protein HMSSN036_08950 [Paenibacillus macerans]